ncbi:MAG TPA: ATP-binding protein, partial [Planctomycetota bacterium]|nr:ATP-binding protein [Planctomycetota bacterium]
PMEAIAGKVIDHRGAVTAVVTILHDRREAIEKARLYEQVKRHSEELEEKVQEATVELVRQNEQLRRQKIQLEEASRLKSQFLANVSHELRTPLHAIIGYTDLLLRTTDAKAAIVEKLQRVDANANHLLKIINDLLDIARIESGKMLLDLADFEIDGLVAEILQEMEPVIARATLKVTHEIPPNLPVLHSDRKKVKQILLNLLANALKFTPEGFVRIDAECSVSGEELSVSVADTGIGIDAQDLRRIFDDFSQLETKVARPQGGTGLGLAICRRLADSLGGRIAVVSKLGLGSTFTLTIPFQAPSRG